ncbi:MAG TPA: hypothetical protein VGH45_09420, partial [Solirubrobacteraceae bacterium]
SGPAPGGAVSGPAPGGAVSGQAPGGAASGEAADPAVSRPPVIAEYHGEGVQAPAAMVRRGRHKLIVAGDDPELLFDLESDPRELDNLAGASPDVVAELRAALAAELDLAEIDRRVRISQRERRLVAAALRQGRYTAWDHQPPADAATQYIRNRGDLYELQRRARLEEPGADG